MRRIRFRLRAKDPKRQLSSELIDVLGVRVRLHRLVPQKISETTEAEPPAVTEVETVDPEEATTEVGPETVSAATELAETESLESQAGAELADAATPPTFFLVHGIGVSSRYFVPLAEELVRYGSVVILDLPGFGGLPAPKSALSIRQFARIATEILTAEKAEKPVVIGHSMGAQIAVEMLASAQIPAPAVLIGPPVNAAERSVSKSAWRFCQSAKYEGPSVSALALLAYLRCGLPWFAAIVPSMMAYPIEKRIKKLVGPVALVRGEYDQIAPKGWLSELAEASPGPTTNIEIAGAAHAVIYQNAKEIAQIAVEVANNSEAGPE